MDSDSVVGSIEGQRHYPLTTLRVIRGVLCLLVLVSTAFVLLVYFGFWTAIILRFFSVHHSRKASAFFFGIWIALWPFFFEKINKTKVVFSGDQVPDKERVLLVANHRTEVDWMYLWDLALRKGCHGYIREQKCKRSQKYASENGLPVLKNVLLPKTKGFYACLENLRGSLDAVYDITIGYRHRCPSFLDNIFGVDPAEVHIHVNRVSLSEIPTSEIEVSSWLMNMFSLKDKMLSDFYRKGHFPREGSEQELSQIKCAVNFIFVMILTGTCTFFTFFSIWFRIYVSLVCAYMASATCFNLRPTPIFQF
ncbi:probable 1-acyl-sn-glycerol-3-phosphate acyltransferase 5 isoform X2 [Primulina huaijiensis]|uniref:probable 1-acyl-sn-glycerol-3-phosphate acyltransferase 5 isoform X2 n=1 Tax=Primulina huaijiensis TaxID=1492673 RepID=UPI003CC77902